MRFRKSISVLLTTMMMSSYSFAYAQSTSSSSATTKPNRPNRVTSARRKKEEVKPQPKPKAGPPYAKKGPGARLLEKYLQSGNLADGEASLTAELQRHPKDDQTRFGLGMLQFIKAIEGLAQDLHKYGVRDLSSEGLNVPFLRIHLADTNPNPETITYEKLRQIFETLVTNFARAEATLAEISDEEVKLPVHFGLIKLDLNGDGKATDDESLWRIYKTISRDTYTEEQAQQFYIAFDRGDVHWLRGYCNLLGAMCNVFLAYDAHETFDCNAHMFFTKVDTPYAFLKSAKPMKRFGGSDVDILDIISLIHLIRWKVAEPERMKTAHQQFQNMVAQSRDTWKFIMAEKDNDREWLPNPDQVSVIPNAEVTQEMVTSWGELMELIDKLLNGEVLIAFWRDAPGQGVNLKKVFMEPQALDLVLWVQGPGAAPYLEKGTTTKIDTWRRLQSAFGGQFPGFAAWFN